MFSCTELCFALWGAALLFCVLLFQLKEGRAASSTAQRCFHGRPAWPPLGWRGNSSSAAGLALLGGCRVAPE